MHEGIVPDLANLTGSSLYDILKFASLADRGGQAIIPPQLLGSAYRLEAKDIDSKLSKVFVRVEAAVIRLFDRLLPIYDDFQRALHAEPSVNCARVLATQKSDG